MSAREDGATSRDTRRARWSEVADADLVAHVESYPARARRLLAQPDGPEIQLRAGAAQLSRFRLDAWRLRLAGEPRETERPPQIADDLQERTPQAILRDLHRPVRPIPPIWLRPIAWGTDPVKASAAAQEVMMERYTVRMAELPDPRAIREDAWRQLRDILGQPWERALPEGDRRKASLEPGPEDALWFGAVGGIDPDQ